MLPVIPKPPISARRKRMALAVAASADFLQIMLLPLLGWGYVLDDFIDVVTALILVGVCGFKWQFILAFMLELVPGLDLLPTWTAVVLLLPARPDQAAGQRHVVAVQSGQRRQHEEIEGEVVVVPPIQARP